MSATRVLRPPGRVVLRRGALSVAVRPRPALVTGALLVLAAALACAAVAVGDYVVPVPDVLRALAGGGDPVAGVVVRTLRLPRVVAGLAAGAAFGLAGAMTQSVTRNPLASPDVLGVSAGASAAAVAALVLRWPVDLPVAALAGGLLTAAVVAALSWRGGLAGPRLLLVGVGVGACATSVTSYLLVRGSITDAQQATVWLTGSLNGRGWDQVRPLLVALGVLVPVALLLGRTLSGLLLGDDVARGLGLRVGRVRLGVVAVAVALASVATACAGPVAFVALITPQVARRLARGPGTPLAASAAAGAVVVAAADLAARTAVPGVQLPVGAVTALVGAPVLLALLRRSARGSA